MTSQIKRALVTLEQAERDVLFGSVEFKFRKGEITFQVVNKTEDFTKLHYSLSTNSNSATPEGNFNDYRK